MSESPVTDAPVCYRHPSKQTFVRCTRCERPICPECMNEASVGHQCPECVAAGARGQRPVRTAFGGSAAGRGGVVTRTLIGVNVLILVLSFVTGGSAAIGGGGWGGLLGGNTPLTNKLAIISSPALYAADPWQYYRLFTAMFVHYGLLHLLVNMYVLWILGRDLERALGPVRFTAIYLLAGLGGNVAAYLFSAPGTATAGASTAIFGLMGAILVILRRLKLSVAPILPTIVINVIFTLTISNISIAGHLGGLVAGAATAAVIAYAPRGNRDRVQWIGLGALLLVLIVLALARTAVGS
jgi:membrane associated rhomboid family serine protease